MVRCGSVLRFSHDTMAELRQYARVLFSSYKITPDGKKIPFSEVNRFFRPARLRIEKNCGIWKSLTEERHLLTPEAAFIVPKVLVQGLTINRGRHPELVRPSLESYGFDLGKTASELFGFPLLWSK